MRSSFHSDGLSRRECLHETNFDVGICLGPNRIIEVVQLPGSISPSSMERVQCQTKLSNRTKVDIYVVSDLGHRARG